MHGTWIALPRTVSGLGDIRGTNDRLLLGGRDNGAGNTVGVVAVDSGNGIVIGTVTGSP